MTLAVVLSALVLSTPKTAAAVPPVANPDFYTATEDTALTKSAADGVKANDTSMDPGYSRAYIYGSPTKGSVTLNEDGSFTYTPNTDATGSDSFTYRLYLGEDWSAAATVSITVNAVNDPPVAVDDSYTTTEGVLLSVPAAAGLLANDTDVDGPSLHVANTSVGPYHGYLTVQTDGSFTYDPDPGYSGPDSFRYLMGDGEYYRNATVTINVGAVNAAPVATGETYTIDEDTPLSVPIGGLLLNDTDIDTPHGLLRVDLFTATMPGNGGTSLGASGEFSFNPVPNFNGTEYLRYRVADGAGGFSEFVTVTINVTPVNDAPVAVDDGYATPYGTALNVVGPGVLGNDTDVDLDPLTAEIALGPSHGSLLLHPNGAYEYTPNAGYAGPDSFTYRAKDLTGANSNVATVRITVQAPPLIPVYRFYNGRTGSHFYTASEAEKATILAHPEWPFTYEGVAYQAYGTSRGVVPLYRFYNGRTGAHFYTASETEKTSVLSHPGWGYAYEGIAFYVSLSPDGTMPVYRFYNWLRGTHFYTASEDERISVVSHITWPFRQEGVAFYVLAAQNHLPE